ncbi:MAG: hypothetical protein ACE149_19765 [Armatimonadota bacterium]
MTRPARPRVSHGDWEYLLRTSERLKTEADAQPGDPGRRPATLSQLLAAKLLDPADGAVMTVDQLAAECERYTRAEVSEMLEGSGQ